MVKDQGRANNFVSNCSTGTLLMTMENKIYMVFIGSAPSLVVSSPYEHELARLRMERLKIEEERLLEMKRQQELEKLRGPLPKW